MYLLICLVEMVCVHIVSAEEASKSMVGIFLIEQKVPVDFGIICYNDTYRQILKVCLLLCICTMSVF